MAILNESVSILIFDDSTGGNSPLRKNVDWKRSSSGVEVSKPSDKEYVIAPRASELLFSGSRILGIDSTSAFSLGLNALIENRYRLTHTGGTSPAFRTDRNLALNGDTVTIVVNNNASVLLSTATISLQALQVGDTVFIPGVLTGDASLNSPFNSLNSGYWTVIGAATVSAPNRVHLARPVGEMFVGTNDNVVITNNDQLQGYSAAGVQIGDSIEIVAGFSSVSQKMFTVKTVTAKFIEFTSSESLPLENDIIPNVNGLVIYSSAKRFVRIEANQEIVVRFNGDTSSNVRLAPITAGSKSGVAWMEKWGPTWSLEVVNRSTAPVTVYLISAE